jgi:hypothetical protein
MNNNKKKSKYVRMSSEDFKAILGLLFEEKNKPKVSYRKFGIEYESNIWDTQK